MVANKHTTSEKSGNWDTTGDKHMHGFKGVGTQTPGQSSQEGSGGRRDGKAQAGGSKAFVSASPHNKFGAGTAQAGCSSASGTREDGMAHGGKTHMFGNRGSQRQTPG